MAAGGLARYTWRRNFHRRHFSYADSRSERPAQGLHDALWRRVGRGAQKHQFQRGKRRIRRHHGRIRLRQDHAPEYPRRARQADLRPGAARRQGSRVHPRVRPRRLPPRQSRLRLSGVQPARHLLGRGQHLSAARARGRATEPAWRTARAHRGEARHLGAAEKVSV